MSGCVSPYLYLEAYDLISHDPYLLTKLGRFEVRILRWAIRHQVLTKELAAQIFEVVEMNQGFHPVHFELMQAAYGTEEKPEYVGQICSYLIRTQQFDTKFHHWYEKGIGLELRITGLYEAYHWMNGRLHRFRKLSGCTFSMTVIFPIGRWQFFTTISLRQRKANRKFMNSIAG